MAGYFPTPLIGKLGIKDGMEVVFVGEPEGYLKEIPRSTCTADFDVVQLFVKENVVFERLLLTYKPLIKKSGMIWVSWPKKSSGVQTDVDENKIRNYALEHGLVDVKVCAIDETWSGLKLVYRLKDR